MSTTLTIRNLDEAVKRRLRVQAAQHGRSMEAEAREILANHTLGTRRARPTSPAKHSDSPVSKGKFDHLVGLWKGRMTTDEIMHLTRGE